MLLSFQAGFPARFACGNDSKENASYIDDFPQNPVLEFRRVMVEALLFRLPDSFSVHIKMLIIDWQMKALA